jgi:hypothetical protein
MKTFGLMFVAVVACAVFAGVATATPMTDKVGGHFAGASSCFACGDMAKYVRADRVWCAWQGDNVVIHVRFRNTSVAHLTISWHPSYTIQGGGSHGDGLTSVQDSGINAHATRGVYVTQQPQGIPPGSPIGQCKPSYMLVETG